MNLGRRGIIQSITPSNNGAYTHVFPSPTAVRQGQWLVPANQTVTLGSKYKRTKTELSSRLFFCHSDWGGLVLQIIQYMIVRPPSERPLITAPLPSWMGHITWLKYKCISSLATAHLGLLVIAGYLDLHPSEWWLEVQVKSQITLA